MAEADVFNPEIILPSLPLRRPGQVHFIEVPAKLDEFGLTNPGDFDLVGARKNDPEHGDPASRQIIHDPVQLTADNGFSKAARCLLVVRF